MLPEKLSNDLCSLRPHEDRACMAVHMWIDKNGELKRHKFVRGLMRSAARLIYEQAQAARDGQPDEVTGPLLEPVIAPLYGAYEALLRGRAARGTLELEIPERQVILGEDGHIEEFMILANVAAAEALEAKKRPAMYRIHEPPPMDKLEALRQALDGLGYKLAKGEAVRPRHFTGILAKVEGTDKEELVSTLILRSQSQAKYSPENPGHFGLALLPAGRRRLERGRGRKVRRDRRAYLRDRTARHRRRTRRHGPLHHRIPGRTRRRDLHRACKRRHPLWPVRNARRDGGRRADPDLDPGRRLFRP
jgi:ribonuclease R